MTGPRKSHHEWTDWLGWYWDLHPLLRLLIAALPAIVGVIRFVVWEKFWPWVFAVSLVLLLIEGWRFVRGKRSEDDYNF